MQKKGISIGVSGRTRSPQRRWEGLFGNHVVAISLLNHAQGCVPAPIPIPGDQHPGSVLDHQGFGGYHHKSWYTHLTFIFIYLYIYILYYISMVYIYIYISIYIYI